MRRTRGGVRRGSASAARASPERSRVQGCAALGGRGRDKALALRARWVAEVAPRTVTKGHAAPTLSLPQ